MAGTLFGSTRQQTAAIRAAARASAAASVAEQRALVELWQVSAPEHREFVSGEVACLLHVSPHTGADRLGQALRLVPFPQLLAALEVGLLGVPHALALLAEVELLAAPHAAAVLAAVLDGPQDADGVLDGTPSQLRSAARRAVITVDPDAARRRHETARKTAGARLRPQPDGMADLVLGCTATEGATVLAALRGRAAAMTFTDTDLTEGQKQVAALLHALGCDRVRVQAVIECPVERAVDLHTLCGAAVWTVDLRVPAAVALGLSDHSAVLAGYGPIGADEARALLPQADLVKACVDSRTGEVLTAEAPARRESWQKGRGADERTTRRGSSGQTGLGSQDQPPDGQERNARFRQDGLANAQALRDQLVAMATTASRLPDLTTDRYIPSAALGGWSTCGTSPASSPATAPPPARPTATTGSRTPSARPARTTCRTSAAAGTAPSTTAGPPPASPTAPSAGTAPAAAPTTDTRSAPSHHPSHPARPCRHCGHCGHCGHCPTTPDAPGQQARREPHPGWRRHTHVSRVLLVALALLPLCACNGHGDDVRPDGLESPRPRRARATP